MYTAAICTVTGIMHGPSIGFDQVMYPVQGLFCVKPNIYIFVIYDHEFYKMTAVSLEQAKAMKAPASVDKYIQAKAGTYDIKDYATVCNMWEGNGYNTQSGTGYNLRDIKVAGCGESCVQMYVCM